MKFTLKVNNRIKEELEIEPDNIGSAVGSLDILEKVAAIAIEADPDDKREPDDCTAAEVIEAWARDSGFDTVKKLVEGLPNVSVSEPGSVDSSASRGMSLSP